MPPVGAAACGRMQVAYAIACVVVHQRAHQLVTRHSPVPVGEMLFASGFTSGYRFSVTSLSVSCCTLSVIALVRGRRCRCGSPLEAREGLEYRAPR